MAAKSLNSGYKQGLLSFFDGSNENSYYLK